MTLRSQIVAECIARFPNASRGAIARIVYRENSLIWPNLAAAALSVRYLTGTLGESHRHACPHKQFMKALKPKNGNCFSSIPKGLAHFKDWESYKLEGEMRILTLYDVHVPYHDTQALTAALEYGQEYRPTHIILAGDFMDFFSLSFWEKDPRKRNFAQELETGKTILQMIRDGFPKAKIIYKIGNHEERLERYMSVKAPELLGIEAFEIPALLDLAKYKIEVVGDKRPLKAGGLYIIHGHEFRWGITSPVNPARGFYLRAKENCIGGHLHQTSSHSEKSLADTVITCWSVGCLCDLHPDYNPINKWNHGVSTITVAKNGHFHVDNRKILDGRIFKD